MESKVGTQSTERLHYTSNGPDSKIPLICSLLALLLAVIGIIVAAVSLSRSGESNIVINGVSSGAQSGGISSSYGDDNRVWLIAIGHTAASTEYILSLLTEDLDAANLAFTKSDEISGEIKGFDVDIINAVCKIARKNCRLTVDVFSSCWNSQAGQSQRGGTGLFSKYYDACTAWNKSYVRARTFQFSIPFAVNDAATFFVKPGNQGNFNWQDVTGKKIGFIDGFVYDEFCIARDSGISGTPILTENILHYPNRDDLLAAVLDGSVDAGFDNKEVWKKVSEVELIDHDSECSIAGRSMMMRKDNDFWKWWDPAFQILVDSAEYRTICKDLLEQHGHVPGPSPEDFCIGYKR